MGMLLFVPLQTIFLFLYCCHSSLAEIRKERIQQVGDEPKTFVVRYKNGDQTIPVTVVLDYKKQTEYVINMNHRSPAKSVTLYDFKQKTIAYKDLTNRECFLGRLTHQTLNEETDALNRLENPVDHQPKLLTLDPHQSALTPTEIRNLAGQKIAVFCRKMNTWLVMPQESHSVRKRDVDDDFEETTYHRHGFHTVQYSHYGRETRRRFRNSTPNGYKPPLYENKNTSVNSNPSFGISEANSSVAEKRLPQEDSIIERKSRDQLILPENVSPITKNNLYKLDHLHGEDNLPEQALSASHVENNSPYYNRNTHPTSTITNHTNIKHSEDEFQSSFSPESDSIDFQGKLNSITHSQNNNLPISENESSNIKNTYPLNTFIETSNKPRNSAAKHFISLRNAEQSFNIRNPRKPLFIENNVKSNLDAEMNELTNYNPESQNLSVFTDAFEEGNKRRQIESELPEWKDTLNGNLLPIDKERIFSANEHKHDISEDPDVSTNVLEIPKISKKFENIDHSQDSGVLLPQTKEDVHDIFEGFYNLRESSPLTINNEFHNSNIFPPENYREKEFSNPEANQVNATSQNKVNNRIHTNADNKEDAFFYTTLGVTSDIDSSTLTTTSYDENKQVTTNPRHSDHFIDSGVFTFRSESDANNFNEKPYYEKNTLLDNHKRIHNNTQRKIDAFPQHQQEKHLGKIPSTYFSTESTLLSQISYSNLNHRSDIPSESDNTETLKLDSHPNILHYSQSKNNQSRQSLVPTEIIHEGVSPQQVRFQTALKDYKPDQIIIDVERIPTQRPPESTLGFRDRSFVISPKSNRKTPSLTQIIDHRQSAQSSGGTWRSSQPSTLENPSRRIHSNSAKQYPVAETYPSRKSLVSQQHRHNGTNRYQHHPVNNIQQRGQFRKQNRLNQSYHPRNNHQPLHQFDSLPPGVSIHPRHPQAPYADMFHSNMPPSLPQDNNIRTVKHHRQRHHRKKNRLTNSCCRTSRKGNGNLSSCCRAGGSCCSSHHGRSNPSRTSCCSSAKNDRDGQVFPSRPNQIVYADASQGQHIRRATENNRNGQVFSPPRNLLGTGGKVSSHQIRNTLGEFREGSTISTRQNRKIVTNESQQLRRTEQSHKDRCLKEKMCRTVYESTQQVMVCRNADIDGCS